MAAIHLGSKLAVSQQFIRPTVQNRGGRASTSKVFAVDTFCKDVVNERKQVTAEGTATVTFLGAEGVSVDVEVRKDQYILEAGLEAGLDLPYSCQGGICGACVGRVAQGSVDQTDIADLEFTINEEQQAKGMSLICMSRPLEDCVVETQSDWGYSMEDWKGPTGYILGKEVEPLSAEA